MSGTRQASGSSLDAVMHLRELAPRRCWRVRGVDGRGLSTGAVYRRVGVSLGAGCRWVRGISGCVGFEARSPPSSRREPVSRAGPGLLIGLAGGVPSDAAGLKRIDRTWTGGTARHGSARRGGWPTDTRPRPLPTGTPRLPHRPGGPGRLNRLGPVVLRGALWCHWVCPTATNWCT